MLVFPEWVLKIKIGRVRKYTQPMERKEILVPSSLFHDGISIS